MSVEDNPTLNRFKAEIGDIFCGVVNGVNGVISSGCGALKIERDHGGGIRLSREAAALLTGVIQSGTLAQGVGHCGDVTRLRKAILTYLNVFDACGGSESVSAEEFSDARHGLREAVAEVPASPAQSSCQPNRGDIAKILSEEVPFLRRMDCSPGNRAGEIADRILALSSTHQSAPAQSAAHNSGSPGSEASGDAGADTFDPSEWEKVIEDRQEAVAHTSTSRASPAEVHCSCGEECMDLGAAGGCRYALSSTDLGGTK